MPKFYDSISPDLQQWALAQPLFFISSAPTSGAHINLSPKGLPSTTFTIFSPTSCGYIDATGSGAETIAHLYENRRATIMFCSFGISPRIMRFFCTGRVVEWDAPEFQHLLAKMGKAHVDGARAVLVFDIFKVQTSCGYGVPKISLPLELSGDASPEEAFEDRKTLGHFAEKKCAANEMGAYQLKNNLRSLDKLPGLRSARRDSGQVMLLEDGMAFLRRVWGQREALGFGVLIGIVVMMFVNLGLGF
ncbi:hypothetical protein GLAREA_02521 [Glarea lozoyensis ATCC 20868]|uniref:Pyridoxamine 5'-phosphate oxidase N-terminal domain-containing protein n=1 Tax=Glarea lozoyensis (strain ATCC 20868 / MF5171) TaxID=1116229 RepID=S3DJ82_GLAL2|nr:uncharacterized protein GLAREA_02521 [Glarea lozoyensis ATCC 20868]EPE26608.1 hypothetical protein GLAREA_02521 [Glarea lozoyensis ATCC 20868]